MLEIKTYLFTFFVQKFLFNQIQLLIFFLNDIITKLWNQLLLLFIIYGDMKNIYIIYLIKNIIYLIIK